MTEAQEVYGRVVDVVLAQARALAGQEALLLDVREDDEWAASHIAGSVHLPLGRFDPTQVPDRPVLVRCRSGNRSGKAARALVSIGRTNVHNLAGGILAWAKSGLPLVTPTEASSEDR
jgi:rhodanese-related sulfurtransferase